MTPTVDLAAHQSLAKVDDVYDQQVASRGNLDLHADADTRAIHRMALCPIDLSTLCFGPRLLEALIKQSTNCCTAVRVALLLDQETKGPESGAELLDERFETKASNSLAGTVIVVLFGDFGHSGQRKTESRIRVFKDSG
jgi:hypothetical protein